jgi:hypothetical protein
MKRLLIVPAAVILLFAVLFLALERPGWLPDAVAAPESERVLVFLVGDRADVEQVRRAVDAGRIVYASEDALALVEGRIVATDAAAASRPVNQAGWGDRRLEIFHVERADPFARGEDAARADVDPERLARLRELVAKPTLTYGEQIFVLQAMHDGIEF